MAGMSAAQRAERKERELCAANLSCPNMVGLEKPYTKCKAHRNQRRDEQIKRRARARQVQNPTTLQAAASPGQFQLPSVPWQKLVWVTSPDKKPLDECVTLTIQFWPEDRESLGHDPWLAGARTLGLRNSVVKSADGSCHVHQGLATLLSLKAMSDLEIEANTWDWWTDRPKIIRCQPVVLMKWRVSTMYTVLALDN
jgi:hypothetical protein